MSPWNLKCTLLLTGDKSSACSSDPRFQLRRQIPESRTAAGPTIGQVEVKWRGLDPSLFLLRFVHRDRVDAHPETREVQAQPGGRSRRRSGNTDPRVSGGSGAQGRLSSSHGIVAGRKSIVTHLTEVLGGSFPRAGRKSPGRPAYSGFHGCKSILNWDVVQRENRFARKPWVRD